ncbi:hypothetical protein UFOVP1382_148 [uncultured Caudovirales phage]|uniref:Gp5/Type VI secretion system Vgr protein OB-fold domain-containing protein n=1 Tax=uncultured Caudovirales phage TaxID=2100421 RepID=A0A6J5S4K6_9CAUD|nr:hypothetical protein UFOVP1382_148 [uncultured Caudovirales phage]
MNIDAMIDTVRRYGLEMLAGRYYGVYRATVADIEDPDKRGRVRLLVPVLGHRAAPEDVWAWPVFPGSGKGSGTFFPPDKDDIVWCSFENGDPSRPLYMGGFIAKDALASEFGGNDHVKRRGWKTKAGHFIRFCDEDSDKHVVITSSEGASVHLDKNGSILCKAKDGTEFNLDAQAGTVNLNHKAGGKLTISATGDVTIEGVTNVTVKAAVKALIDAVIIELGQGAVDGLIKGTTFMPAFLTHTHIGVTPGPGVTGPVLPALAALFQQTISTTSKTK